VHEPGDASGPDLLAEFDVSTLVRYGEDDQTVPAEMNCSGSTDGFSRRRLQSARPEHHYTDRYSLCAATGEGEVTCTFTAANCSRVVSLPAPWWSSTGTLR
jgi:hypothetical protein